MKKRIVGICLLSLSCLPTFAQDGVQMSDDIQAVANDLVLHYDRAVILGTSSASYIEEQKQVLGDILREKLTVEVCGEINLYTCALDLLCAGKIPATNLRSDLLPCDN